MFYTIDTKLKGDPLNKMIESIPPIIRTISDISESSNSIEEFIMKMDYLPFSSINWINSSSLEEYDIIIVTSNYFSFKINIKGFIRNLKIDKLLNIG